VGSTLASGQSSRSTKLLSDGLALGGGRASIASVGATPLHCGEAGCATPEPGSRGDATGSADGVVEEVWGAGSASAVAAAPPFFLPPPNMLKPPFFFSTLSLVVSCARGRAERGMGHHHITTSPAPPPLSQQ
jgi:hypothetical protein